MIDPGQQRDESGGDRIGGNILGRVVGEGVDQCSQSPGCFFLRHSRKASSFAPRIDIEPRKRGQNAEHCSISILAD